MAFVGDGWSKASNFGCSGCGWQDDFVSEINWELREVGDVSEAALQLREDLEEGGRAQAAKDHVNRHNQKFHEDVCKDNGQVWVVD